MIGTMLKIFTAAVLNRKPGHELAAHAHDKEQRNDDESHLHVVGFLPAEILKAFERMTHDVERPFPCRHIKIESHKSDVLLSFIAFLEQFFLFCALPCTYLVPPGGKHVDTYQKHQNDYSEYGEVVSDEVHTPALERVVVAGLGVVVEVLHRRYRNRLRSGKRYRDRCMPASSCCRGGALPPTAVLLPRTCPC